MQFSVIIPAHNAEKTLRRAVESVLAAMEFVESDAVIASHRQEEDENPKPLFEILIVENGSEDATEFIARSLQCNQICLHCVLTSALPYTKAQVRETDPQGVQKVHDYVVDC